MTTFRLLSLMCFAGFLVAIIRILRTASNAAPKWRPTYEQEDRRRSGSTDEDEKPYSSYFIVILFIDVIFTAATQIHFKGVG